MYLFFHVDGAEGVDFLRHFAECRTHQGITLDALIAAAQHFIEDYDAGKVRFIPGTPAKVGVEITQGDDRPGGQDGATGTPQAGGMMGEILEAIDRAIREAAQEAAKKTGGPVGPPRDIRSN